MIFQIFFHDFWKHFRKSLFSSIFNGFGYHFGGDLGRILHQMGVFLHLKNYSDSGARFREPQGSPREPGEHTGNTRRTLPAPKGKVPSDLESTNSKSSSKSSWTGRCKAGAGVQGRCMAGAGARQVQGRCRCKAGARQVQRQVQGLG